MQIWGELFPFAGAARVVRQHEASDGQSRPVEG